MFLKNSGWATNDSIGLDFLMRNTDRGADNYMLKYCEGNNERSLIDIAPSRFSTSTMPVMRERMSPESRPATLPTPSTMHQGPSRPSPSAAQDYAASPYTRLPHLHVRFLSWVPPHNLYPVLCDTCHFIFQLKSTLRTIPILTLDFVLAGCYR